jgi:uncharacterized protein YyaL (SSP411 family)
VRGKIARAGKTTAYVCEKGVCRLPTDRVEIFGRQLRATAKPAAGDPREALRPRKK